MPHKHFEKFFFEMIMNKLLLIVCGVFLGCAIHIVANEKAHNYMLTPEHRTLFEPLNPISQLAVLHPEQC